MRQEEEEEEEEEEKKKKKTTDDRQPSNAHGLFPSPLLALMHSINKCLFVLVTQTRSQYHTTHRVVKRSKQKAHNASVCCWQEGVKDK